MRPHASSTAHEKRQPVSTAPVPLFTLSALIALHFAEATHSDNVKGGTLPGDEERAGKLPSIKHNLNALSVAFDRLEGT